MRYKIERESLEPSRCIQEGAPVEIQRQGLGLQHPLHNKRPNTMREGVEPKEGEVKDK